MDSYGLDPVKALSRDEIERQFMVSKHYRRTIGAFRSQVTTGKIKKKKT